ncbi:hypothetical protein [Streptomyces aidingensis]|uniref:Uncharacterized protein n=1 Tax=Streptomyces aidingensis TaxID=910347 RepID=A0A1I1R412_9ACTN|nr:hypothetical protein [Streptomyces aidingensis]SFD29076.1 hypothetical protein SAMN05421773_112171 [Streptomyces aidingensis]
MDDLLDDEQAARPVGPPARYRLITPTEWFRIPLVADDARDRAVRALVDLTWPSRDEHAAKRRELRELIGDVAREGAAKDGLEMYLSTQTVLGVPVPASLLISMEAEERGRNLQLPYDGLAEDLREKYPTAQVDLTDLPAGRAVRCRRTEVPEDAVELGVSEQRPTTLLEYFVQVPNAGLYLLLTFSTPLPELADALVEMFDAIAASLSWIPAPTAQGG